MYVLWFHLSADATLHANTTPATMDNILFEICSEDSSYARLCSQISIDCTTLESMSASLLLVGCETHAQVRLDLMLEQLRQRLQRDIGIREYARAVWNTQFRVRAGVAPQAWHPEYVQFEQEMESFRADIVLTPDVTRAFRV
jgi:hypothetical protein